MLGRRDADRLHQLINVERLGDHAEYSATCEGFVRARL
jgi:hypothetical protein